jgi:hypothetical protein
LESYRERRKRWRIRDKDEGRGSIKRAQAKYRGSVGFFQRRYWKDWEIQFLIDNIWAPERTIAVSLGRSINSVALKYQRLGLDKPE